MSTETSIKYQVYLYLHSLTLLACWYPYPICLLSHTRTTFAIAVTVTLVFISSSSNFHEFNKHLVSAVNEIVLKTYHSTYDVVNVEHQILIAPDHVQALPELVLKCVEYILNRSVGWVVRRSRDNFMSFLIYFQK